VAGTHREQSEGVVVLVVAVYYHIDTDEIDSVVLNENLDGEVELHLNLQVRGILSLLVADADSFRENIRRDNDGIRTACVSVLDDWFPLRLNVVPLVWNVHDLEMEVEELMQQGL
jgi:hypothetical protein